MGGSASTPSVMEAEISKLYNPKVTKKVEYVTVPFQVCKNPKGGAKVVPSPTMRKGNHFNPLGNLVDHLDFSKKQCIVISEIKVEYVKNQTDIPMTFCIENIFDFNENDMKKKRNTFASSVRAANENSNQQHATAAAVRKEKKEGDNDDNNDDDDHDKERTQIRVLYGKNNGVYLNENKVEKENKITIFVPKNFDGKVRENLDLLYSSTLNSEYIEKFAGQHESLLSVKIPPTYNNNNKKQKLVIFQEKDPLFIFINKCREILEGNGEIIERTAEDNQNAKFYSCDPRLVISAQEMLKIIVYSKMYYTTLKDTRVSVELTEEKSRDLNKKWGKNSTSDYNPVIFFILKIVYYEVFPEMPNSPIYEKISKLI